MDSNRFDTLARNASAIDSRRNAIKALAASGLAIGLAKIGLGATAAKNKKKKNTKSLGQTCKKSSQCKGDLACQTTDELPDANGICQDVTPSKRCCVKLGGRCDHGCDCCGTSVICNGHVCQSA